MSEQNPTLKEDLDRVHRTLEKTRNTLNQVEMISETRYDEILRLRGLLLDGNIKRKELTDQLTRHQDALRDIATMPKHDQDDEHRLRHKAKVALTEAQIYYTPPAVLEAVANPPFQDPRPSGTEKMVYHAELIGKIARMNGWHFWQVGAAADRNLVSRYQAALERIRDSDYRGNRHPSADIAAQALNLK